MTSHTQLLLSKYPIISDQIKKPALAVVLGQLERILSDSKPLGAVVEFGCYVGTTSLFIRRMLDNYQQSSARQFHVYDSFEGLPEKTSDDQSSVGVDFRGGELAVGRKQLLAEFQKVHLVPPKVHKAWFKDLTASQVPDGIAFAFLDGDFYESILSSLRLVWPRLQPGGVVCIDDYQRPALPGVERAVHDFFQAKARSEATQITQSHNIGIITRENNQKLL